MGRISPPWLRQSARARLTRRAILSSITGHLLWSGPRGAQYTALSFGKKLELAGIVPSMSRVGSALDNAISESFVSTLKSEIGVSRYPERQTARASIFEFIESYYNRVRRHSSLGYLSPTEYEQATMEEAAVA